MTRRAWRRLGPLVVTAVALGLLLGACGGVVGAVVNTTKGLQQAGYQSPRVGLSSGDDTFNEVTVSVTVNARPSQPAAEGAARVVWADLHDRFGSLKVTVHGHGPALVHRWTFAQLQDDFGARNPAWNRHTIKSSAESFGIIVLVVLGVIVVGVVLLIVLLARRGRSRRRGPPPPPPPGAWLPPGSGASTWGPPGDTGGWGAPAPKR